MIRLITANTFIPIAATLDPAKRLWTLQNRGIDFAVDAEKAVAGKTATKLSENRDFGEARYITAGFVDGRMVVMVWTPRGADRHIISMRYCHAKEESRWAKIIR